MKKIDFNSKYFLSSFIIAILSITFAVSNGKAALQNNSLINTIGSNENYLKDNLLPNILNYQNSFWNILDYHNNSHTSSFVNFDTASNNASPKASLVGSFTIAATPSSRTVIQGGTVTYSITVQSTGGFNSSVSLNALNLPGNQVLAGTGFSPQTVTPPANGSTFSTLTIVTNNQTPTGDFTITVRGAGSGITKDVTINLTVNAPDFSVSSSPTSRTVTQGNTTNYSISLSSLNGFSGNVSLAAINLPGNQVLPGTGFAPTQVTLTSGGSASSTLTIVTNSQTQTGTFTITVRGTGNGLTRDRTITLTVNSPPSPTITSISPSNVCAQNGNRSFTVNGSLFQSNLTIAVTFPGGGGTTLSGTQITGVTSTSFTMIATLNVIGTYSFRVNNPDGTQSNNFSYTTQNCIPQIDSISPSSPSVSNNNQSVDVFGINFQSSLTITVFFPGGGSTDLSGSQIQSVTSTSVRMIVTLNIVGTYGIRVNNPNGTQSNTFNFQTQAASPSISSISQANPCVRNIDQSITVNGSNFINGLTVSVTFPNGSGGTLQGTQIQNITSTSFTMLITVADPGSYTIRVNNPGGAQSGQFTFSTQNCLTVSGTNPSSPTQNNIDQDVTVNGSGFAANLTVTVTFPDNSIGNLSGSQIFNVTSTSFLMKITLNAVGSWKIKVRNPNGDLSNIYSFTVQAPAPPTISSINPNSPTASNTDQNLTVNGTNFQNGLTVTVTFPNGNTGILSGTQIQNVTVNSFTMRITLGNAGNWSLRVINSNGGQSSNLPFTVQSNVQTPVIFSLNPITPVVGNTNQDITIIGNNFQQNLSVSINFPAGGGTTLNGTQIQNVTANSFIMRATLNAVGNWTIRVNNSDGGQSSVFGFSVSGGGNNPVINSINPLAPMTGGADQNVIVNGSNFQDGLIVNVTFPSGGIATLQGTGQIQNVTANSFLMKITLNAIGSWTIRVINPNNSQSQQFAFNVQASEPLPTGLPTSVLSPVIGSLRVTSTNQGINDGKWEFDQHKTGFHTPTGGISHSNDTYAWDANLYTPTNGNADVGKAVFAVADGEVVSYVGTPLGGGPGAVLIAHPNAANPVWFSGYLHMMNVRVTPNQPVNSTTIIGEIGRVGANNDHLHFVVYSGQNTRGNLISFNTVITDRLSNNTNPPIITSVFPERVIQSIKNQVMTINGANFQTNSIIEVQDPYGNNFPITPEPASVVENAKIEGITSSTITAEIPFAFDGTYTVTVINRPSTLTNVGTDNSSFATSSNYEVISSPSFMNDTPVVLIPGVMGSRLGKKIFGNTYDEIFPSTPYNAKHSYLKTDIGFGNPIGERPIVATDIFREYFGGLGGRADFYGTMIDTFTGPYSGYKLYRVTNPTQRTLVGCDVSQQNANFFIFPYDWRSSNEQSARDFKGLH